MKRYVEYTFLAILLAMAATPVDAQQKKKKPTKPKPVPDARQVLEQGCDRIVFATRQPTLKDGHWYANIGYFSFDENLKLYEEGGHLCILNLKSGEIDVLLEDATGTIRDPAVHYDAQKIIFSYRKGSGENFHLYEINVDGSGMKQLTFGEYDEYEPCYLPDGGIVFTSTRAKRWVNCFVTQVGTIYRCNADGSGITELSPNLEHDNTPWPLPDGRILYQRWEYIDRSQMVFHHLWTMNPDGTGQMVYYGNMHPEGVLIDGKPVPDSNEVIVIECPKHGRADHRGRVVLLSDQNGPDDLSMKKYLTKQASYCDPYALAGNFFIAAQERSIVSLNREGKQRLVFKLPDDRFAPELVLFEPRPLIPHEREKFKPDLTDPAQDVGTMLLTSVYIGRKMGTVEKGTVKKLLIMEALPKPINFQGGMAPITMGGSFTLERILGTVPVEEDGSAYFELPAKRALFFVALDGNDDSVKRMHSFTTVMPGETLSCVGCHEERTFTPQSQALPMAAKRAASKIRKIEGIPELYDFPRDIQPIFDKHCVKCHNPEKRKGHVILTGDRGPIYSHSYEQLTLFKQVADGRNRKGSNYDPYVIGAANSPLMKKLSGEHHGVKLSEHEIRTIRYWIESAAVYPGTYAALGSGCIGGKQRGYERRTRQILNVDFEWETSIKGSEVIKKRCASCHKGNKLTLPKNLSDERRLFLWRPEWDGPKVTSSRHILYNLTRPEKSVLLLGPLSKEAGGYGSCKEVLKLYKSGAIQKLGNPVEVFKDTSDPDYQTLLAMIQAGKDMLGEIKRFDMPGFRPRGEYLREMKRFGILSESFDVGSSELTMDAYEMDRRYWESLWHKPADQ